VVDRNIELELWQVPSPVGSFSFAAARISGATPAKRRVSLPDGSVWRASASVLSWAIRFPAPQVVTPESFERQFHGPLSPDLP